MNLAQDQFFQLLITVGVIPIVMALGKLIFWVRMNQPATAAILGGLLGGAYYSDAIYYALHNQHVDPEFTLAMFIVSGAQCGFAASGVKSFLKDVGDGTISATTPEDVIEIRAKKSSKDGIGS